MPFTPINVFTSFADDVDVDKVNLRAVLNEINSRLGNLVAAWSSYQTGEVLCLGDDGLGPISASDGAVAINFAGRQLGHFIPERVEVSGGLTLSHELHAGRFLWKRDSGGAVLTLDADPDPENGVLQGFTCSLWRQLAGGDLQVQSSMSNEHPEGHTRVQAGGVATLICDTEVGIWRLIGETEL